MVEENPYAPFFISHSAKANVAEDIRVVVNEYYGISNESTNFQTVTAESTYTSTGLEHSTVHATWNEAFEYFNCYGFAIDEIKYKDPGFFDWMIKNPTNIDAYNLSVSTTDIEAIVELVISDLTALNKERIIIQPSQMGTSNLCSNETVICVRGGPHDYHFMRYTPDGWLHKPGNSQILRYNYTPTDEVIWTNEAIYRNSYYPATIIYNSTIYFISYNGHDWEYVSHSNGTYTKHCDICGDTISGNCNLSYSCYNNFYHIGKCTGCGYSTEISDCTYTYEYDGSISHTATCTLCNNSIAFNCNFEFTAIGNNQHHLECTVCGGGFDEDCVAVATYCGNASLGDIHSLACRDCGNSMGTEPTACTFSYHFSGTVNGVNTHDRLCDDCGYAKATGQLCMYKNGDNCLLCGTSRDVVMTPLQARAVIWA